MEMDEEMMQDTQDNSESITNDGGKSRLNTIANGIDIRDIASGYFRLILGGAKGLVLTDSEAKQLIRYIFEKIIFENVPAENVGKRAVEYITPQYAEALKLPIIINRLDLPEDIDKHDYKHIVAFCFDLPYAQSAADLLALYESIGKEGSPRQGPKEMFNGAEGYRRQREVFRLFLSKIVPSYPGHHSVERAQEAYGLFADSRRITTLLKEHGMFYPMRHFTDVPLDCLHQFIDDQDRSNALYAAYKFKSCFHYIARKKAEAEKERKKVKKTVCKQ